jgi:hypothetical protein
MDKIKFSRPKSFNEIIGRCDLEDGDGSEFVIGRSRGTQGPWQYELQFISEFGGFSLIVGIFRSKKQLLDFVSSNQGKLQEFYNKWLELKSLQSKMLEQ